MAKRKFKEIKKNSEKSSQSPNRSYKRSKLSPGTDSDRIFTLTQKKVKARLFDKINVKNKEAYNKLKFNDDSPEEKKFSNHSGSEASDTLFIDTKNSKKRKRGKKIKIYNERIFLRKQKMLPLSQKVHVPQTFLITRVFLPHYWIFSSSERYKEMVTAYLGHYVS